MAQQNEGGNDSIVAMAIILLIIFAIWYFLGQKIAIGYIFIKKAELLLLQYSGVEWFVQTFAPSIWEKHAIPAIELMYAKKKGGYSAKELSIIGSGIGYFSRFFYIGIIGFFAYKVWKKNPSQRFKVRYSMKTLAKSEQRQWPAIAPVVNLDLVSEPIDKGKWAMAKRPVDFARYYSLLDEENKLIRNKSEKLFAAQLGKLWEGPNRLRPYERALFTAFIAQACGDLEGAKKGLNLLSVSMAAGKPDYSWVLPLLKTHYKDEKIQKIVKKHAYVYTVMASVLKEARTFGVCASAQFIWLRPVNRPLWYTLNGVGRRVAFAEVAGIFAHWIAEEVAGQAIERPYVIKAVDGLERAIMDVKFD